MVRIKSIFAALMLTAIVGVVPQAQAQTLKVVIAGSSALWQTLALGAYNNGSSIVSGGGTTFHYTSGANFNLIDNRSTVATVDSGATWIVWDSASPVNVWAFVKVDSVVGNRCYFAAPKCVLAANGSFPAAGNSIVVWPDASADTVPPAAVQTPTERALIAESSPQALLRSASEHGISRAAPTPCIATASRRTR